MKIPFVVILIVALAGCSKSAPDTGSSSTSTAAAGGGKVAAAAPAGNACDRKLLVAADLADVLKGTVTVGPLDGDPQSCKFTAGYDSVTVALRPGQGDVTVQTVLSGGENVDATALAGVGDKAAWTASLNEVNATKNGVLCDISAPNISQSGKMNATRDSIGALCTKIFARM